MAYVDQALKQKLAPRIKAVLNKYGLKGSLSVRNHSTLVLNIKSGKIDFIKNFNDVCSKEPRHPNMPFQPATKSLDVNVYHYQRHFSGRALDCLNELVPAMNDGNFDKSDIMTDYFHVGWYVDINIGNWKDGYQVA